MLLLAQTVLTHSQDYRTHEITDLAEYVTVTQRIFKVSHCSVPNRCSTERSHLSVEPFGAGLEMDRGGLTDRPSADLGNETSDAKGHDSGYGV